MCIIFPLKNWLNNNKLDIKISKSYFFFYPWVDFFSTHVSLSATHAQHLKLFSSSPDKRGEHRTQRATCSLTRWDAGSAARRRGHPRLRSRGGDDDHRQPSQGDVSRAAPCAQAERRRATSSRSVGGIRSAGLQQEEAGAAPPPRVLLKILNKWRLEM